LANRNKQKLHKLQMMQGVKFTKPDKKTWKEIAKTNLGFDVDTCPHCKTGKMIRMMSFDTNPPPKLAEQIKKLSLKTKICNA